MIEGHGKLHMGVGAIRYNDLVTLQKELWACIGGWDLHRRQT